MLNTTVSPLQSRMRVTSNPDPPPFALLQFNCDGVRDKIHEIVRFMEQKNIKTKLIDKSKISVPNYTILRKDSIIRLGGGLAFMINSSIQFKQIVFPAPLDCNTTIEQLAIAVTSVKPRSRWLTLTSRQLRPVQLITRRISITCLLQTTQSSWPM